jgi:transcriptional regulator with GAF, ATPase, and Fis domain
VAHHLDRRRGEEVTSTEASRHDRKRASGPLVLRVLQDGVLATFPLPNSGEVTIGRSSSADVLIDHPSVSRRHALLAIGATIQIEDLGSANGTRLGDRRLAPGESVRIAVGDAVDLGAVLMVIQPEHPLAKSAEASREEGGVEHDGVMARLLRLRDRVAAGNISVLLLGETGVGKEVMAESIHRASPRHDRPFLRLNCAALSETLLESELFGYEKGAFTGAVQSKPGLLEIADGGTVLLDEVGDLPLTLQVKLLRVLEDRQVLRVGGLRPRPIDVRFISATNRDLEAQAEQERFRRDLYFRLNGISLVIPPLRERTNEIQGLAQEFAVSACQKAGRSPVVISREVLGRLERNAWPGNVRELRNVMERAVLLCTGDVLTSEYLPPELGLAPLLRAPAPTVDAPDVTGPLTLFNVDGQQPPPVDQTPSVLPKSGLRDEVAALERTRIMEALARCGGNQTRAAKLLGMRRQSLVARLDAYGVPRPRKPTPGR